MTPDYAALAQRLRDIGLCLGVVALVVLVIGTGGLEREAFGKRWGR